MRIRTYVLAGLAILATSVLAVQGQVPGVNSTLNSVFTLAYDNSTMKPTYSATAGAISLASAATDVCSISGSATKNIRVRRIILAGVGTSIATDPVAVVKRSTVSLSGATGAFQPTVVPYDSGSSAGTAVVEAFQVNPSSLGTLVGVLADVAMIWGNLTTGTPTMLTFTFGTLGSPVVLRGAAQQLAVNLNAYTYGGGKLDCTIEWTEE